MIMEALNYCSLTIMTTPNGLAKSWMLEALAPNHSQEEIEEWIKTFKESVLHKLLPGFPVEYKIGRTEDDTVFLQVLMPIPYDLWLKKK